MTEEEYRILEDLYMTRWPGNKRGNSLMKKCEALYDLARQAEGGCILELGAYHGCGTISLVFGARAGHRVPVFTVDDFAGREGWAGEGYFPQDRNRFFDCIDVAGVRGGMTLIQELVAKANDRWEVPISLLFWDLGVKGRLMDDFTAWERHVIPGGVFAMREGGDRILGSRVVMPVVEGRGWSYGEQFPAGHVYTMVKNV